MTNQINHSLKDESGRVNIDRFILLYRLVLEKLDNLQSIRENLALLQQEAFISYTVDGSQENFKKLEEAFDAYEGNNMLNLFNTWKLEMMNEYLRYGSNTAGYRVMIEKYQHFLQLAMKSEWEEGVLLLLCWRDILEGTDTVLPLIPKS